MIISVMVELMLEWILAREEVASVGEAADRKVSLPLAGGGGWT